MKRIAFLCALLLLLTACGKTAGPEDAPPPPAAEGPAEMPDGPETGAPVELETLLADIYAAVPGAEDSTLKAVYAAGELLDYTMDRYCHSNDPNFDGPHEPEEDDFQDFVSQWVAANVPAGDAVALVWAWDAVMTQAEALLAKDPDALALLEKAGHTQRWDGCDEKYLNWWGFSSLYTQIFDRVTSTPYQEEAGAFASVSDDRLDGLWLNSERQTLLIFRNGCCRVVYPLLSCWGEIAGAYRVRDRSDQGYCPALEIDYNGEGPINEDGDFHGPLTYYVSGMDDTHFWCSGQQERFDRIDLVADPPKAP